MGKYNPEIHHRCSIRLKDYDYSQSGAYFITICTYRGRQVFGEVHNGQMILNTQGKIAYTKWLTLPTRFLGIELDQFVIMPNHAHGIIVRTQRLAPDTRDVMLEEQPILKEKNKMQLYRTSPYRRQMLCEVVRTFKGVTSYYVRRSEGGMMHGFSWHRDYFEHVIRDARELDAMRTYIINNPAKWQEDKLHPLSGWKLRE